MIGKVEVQVGVIMLNDWEPNTGAQNTQPRLIRAGQLKRHAVVGLAEANFVTTKLVKSNADTM